MSAEGKTASVLCPVLLLLLLSTSDCKPASHSLQPGPACKPHVPVHLQCPERKYCHGKINQCVPCYSCTKRLKEEPHTGCAVNENMCGDCIQGTRQTELPQDTVGQQRYRCKWLSKTTEHLDNGNSTTWKRPILIGTVSVITLLGAWGTRQLYVSCQKPRRKNKNKAADNCPVKRNDNEETEKTDNDSNVLTSFASVSSTSQATDDYEATNLKTPLMNNRNYDFLADFPSEASFMMEGNVSEEKVAGAMALPTDKADEELSQKHHAEAQENSHQLRWPKPSDGSRNPEAQSRGSRSFGTQPLPGEIMETNESTSVLSSRPHNVENFREPLGALQAHTTSSVASNFVSTGARCKVNNNGHAREKQSPSTQLHRQVKANGTNDRTNEVSRKRAVARQGRVQTSYTQVVPECDEDAVSDSSIHGISYRPYQRDFHRVRTNPFEDQAVYTGNVTRCNSSGSHEVSTSVDQICSVNSSNESGHEPCDSLNGTDIHCDKMHSHGFSTTFNRCDGHD